jgi:hypothetical protein
MDNLFLEFPDYTPPRSHAAPQGVAGPFYRIPSQRIVEPFPNPPDVGPLPPQSDGAVAARRAAYKQCPGEVLSALSLPDYMKRAAHQSMVVRQGVFVTDGETYTTAGLLYARCIGEKTGENIRLARCGDSPHDCRNWGVVPTSMSTLATALAGAPHQR